MSETTTKTFVKFVRGTRAIQEWCISCKKCSFSDLWKIIICLTLLKLFETFLNKAKLFISLERKSFAKKVQTHAQSTCYGKSVKRSSGTRKRLSYSSLILILQSKTIWLTLVSSFIVKCVDIYLSSLWKSLLFWRTEVWSLCNFSP